MTFFKTRSHGLLASLMLVLCLAFVACGGDDDKKSDSKSDTTAAEKSPTTTEAAPGEDPVDPAPVDPAPEGEGDFANAANALCASAKESIQAAAEEGDAATVVGLSAQLTEDIAALEPPAEQQEQFDALIELARANDAEAMRIVEDGGTIDDIAALESPEADAIATELGMTGCV